MVSIGVILRLVSSTGDAVSYLLGNRLGSTGVTTNAAGTLQSELCYTGQLS